jgi:hypothetical protein
MTNHPSPWNQRAWAGLTGRPETVIPFSSLHRVVNSIVDLDADRRVAAG